MPLLSTFLLWAAATLIVELLRPKPEIENARPSTLGDFDFPTASESRRNPIIAGKVRVKAPNVVWAGDFEAVAITEKIKTGLFSSSTRTTGFQYFMGMQLAICRGELDELHTIWSQESELWTGSVMATGGIAAVDAPEFFGGDEVGGSGGFVADFAFHKGSLSQSADSYLAGFQNDYAGTTIVAPAYVGSAYLAMRRAYVGNVPRIAPLSFEVSRYPNPASLGLTGGIEKIGVDSNPVAFLYELYTNTEWGLNLSTAQMDTAGWQAAAQTVFDDGLGMSLILSSPMDAISLRNEMLRLIDGVVYEDPADALLKINLNRAFSDVEIAALPVLDDTNSVLESVKRAGFGETLNQIVVEYVDREQLYTVRPAQAIDDANIAIQGQSKPATVSYVGIASRAVAQMLADRELNEKTLPLAVGSQVPDRVAHTFNPGDGFVLNNPGRNIVGYVCRVTRIRPGSPEDRRIKIDWSQAANFALIDSGISDPQDSGFTPPATTAVVPIRERLWEPPYQLAPNNNSATIAALVTRDGGFQLGYEVHTDFAGGTAYLLTAENSEFTPSGTLPDAVSGDIQAVGDYLVAINVSGLSDVTTTTLAAMAASTVTTGEAVPTAILIDDELLWFESVTDNLDGSVTLNNCHRGWSDTIPEAHLVGAAVWFIGLGIGLLHEEVLPSTLDPGDVVTAKILTRTSKGTLAIGTAVQLSITFTERVNLPIPPADPIMNEAFRLASLGVDNTAGSLRLAWAGRNRFAQALDTDQDDAHIDPSSVFGAVSVTRRDTDAEVLGRTGIPLSGTGGAFNAEGIVPVTVVSGQQTPDTLELAISLKHTNAAGESAGYDKDFDVDSGYGINYGENYGGTTNTGAWAEQGDPPIVPEPVPGVDVLRFVSFTVEGSVGTADDYNFVGLFAPYGVTPIPANIVEFDFTVPSTGKASREEMAQAIFAEFSAITDVGDLWIDLVDVSLNLDKVTISSYFGSFSVLISNDSPGARTELLEAASPIAIGQRQTVAIDLYEEIPDPATGQDIPIYSPDSGPYMTGFISQRSMSNIIVLLKTRSAQLAFDPSGETDQYATNLLIDSFTGAGLLSTYHSVAFAGTASPDPDAGIKAKSDEFGWNVSTGSGVADFRGDGPRSSQVLIQMPENQEMVTSDFFDAGQAGPDIYRWMVREAVPLTLAHPAGAEQISSMTLSFGGQNGVKAAGQVLRLVVDGTQYLYTVLASDLTDDPTHGDPIYEGILAAYTGPFTTRKILGNRPDDTPHTDGRDTFIRAIEFEADTINDEFDISASFDFGTRINIDRN